MSATGGARTALDLPLAGDRVTLIQASAGTGKTYALTTLAARLVVEERQEIGALLVVTFTNAATDELRDKIRHTLRAALRLVLGDPGRPEPQARELMAHWDACGIARTEVAGRLDVAIADLDRANVLTIHGFCQRVLRDFAFECGLPFGFEVTGDGFDTLKEVVRDYWRRALYPAPPSRVRYAFAQRFLPDELADWVAGNVAKRGLEIRGAEPLDDAAAAALGDCERRWAETLEEARGALQSAAARRVSDGDLEVAAVAIEGAEAALTDKDGSDFAPGAAAAAVRKRYAALGDSLDTLHTVGSALRAQYDAWLPRARRAVLEDARRAIDARARDERMLGYDDLLTVVHSAVAGSGNLATRIRARFPFALIDEYQDTDRIQADIFQRIYAGGQGRLVIVGDPKQSIYRFRSADIFAYLKASERIGPGDRLSLARNYRSVPPLVAAVNALFDRPHPFVLPDIAFEPVASAYPADAPRLIVAGEGATAPLQFRMFLGRDGKRPPKGEVTTAAARQAAHEIATLLALAARKQARIGDRPLAGGDIAVLVRKTDQGRAVADELRRRGVRSIEIGDADVFESREAEQLERLLWAVAKPQSSDRVRGALASDLFGLEATDLARLVDDDEAWNVWKERLDAWRAVWEASGVATMIRRLLWAFVDKAGQESGTGRGAARLLQHPLGPRRLTNVMHLAELLQQAEADARLSPTGVASWFSRRRAHARRGDEVAQLRLESDEDLVKIVSIHRSKGLEFPVVFCPFAWDARTPAQNRRGRAEAVYHERSCADYGEVLHLAPSGAEFDQEWLEDFSDEMRLLYVALTRARLRCVVSWGPVNQSEHAPLGWLLDGRDTAGGPEDPELALRTAATAVKRLKAEDWTAAIERIGTRCPGGISVATVATDADVPVTSVDAKPAVVLRARRFQRRLRRVRQMTSYSALVRAAGVAEAPFDHEQVELPDHDGALEAVADEVSGTDASRKPDVPERTPFTFPSGPRAGNCLHRMFERLDDPANAADIETVCRESLAAFGIGDEWVAVARSMVEDARAVRLSATTGPGSGDIGGFRLGALARPIAEMEFHFPAEGVDRRRLGATLETHGYGNPLAGASSRPVEGYLRGFIDLVAVHDGCWYVVDYKSNLLGPTADRYAGAHLDEAMGRSGYRLQYLIYLLALHRHLALRLPGYDYERHVGGAFYLFLRGMDPAAGMARGVYFDRPSAACMAAIDACFGGVPPVAARAGSRA